MAVVFYTEGGYQLLISTVDSTDVHAMITTVDINSCNLCMYICRENTSDSMCLMKYVSTMCSILAISNNLVRHIIVV